MKGIAYVVVKVYFETDLTPDEIQDVISNTDYEFNHKMISHSEIVENDLSL